MRYLIVFVLVLALIGIAMVSSVELSKGAEQRPTETEYCQPSLIEGCGLFNALSTAKAIERTR